MDHAHDDTANDRTDTGDEDGDDSQLTGLPKLTQLFAEQDGLMTYAQAKKAKLPRGVRRARLATGEWRAVDRTVVANTGMPGTWRRDVRAALLSVGDDAALSHVTAGRLHGFDGLANETEIHVTVFGSTHHTAPQGVVVHRSRLLTAKSCVLIDGMRVASKPIALMQIAATRGADPTRKALDGMLREGDSMLWIRTVAQSWRRRGVAGPRLVLDLLDATEQRLPRSWFQRLARRVLATTGLQLVDEHPVTDPVTGKHLADLDLAAPELKLGIECQSWAWHSTPTARAADALRKRRLRRAGWEIIELWWVDLDRPDEVLADIADAIERLRPAV